MNGKSLTLIGTLLTLALTSNVAVAQSSQFSQPELISQETGSSEEPPKKLRPDVMKVLCTNFPLNSRCQGSAEGTQKAPESSTTESQPSETPTNPENTTTPEGTTTPESETPDGTLTPPEGTTTPESETPDGTLTPPEGTITPESETPDGTLTPAPGTITPESETPDGTLTPAPGTITPESETPDGTLTPAPGTTTPESGSPSNMTAPENPVPSDSLDNSNTPGSTSPIVVPGSNSEQTPSTGGMSN